MRKSYVLLAFLGSAIVVTAFQNCSSGDLPTASEDASLATPIVYADLKLQISNQTPLPGSAQTIYAVGGKPDYVFAVISGTCTVVPNADQVSATLTAGAVADTVCQISLKDAQPKTAFSTVTITAAVVTAPTEPEIVPDSQPFTSSQSFVLPAYAKLTIEVWGGGGAGGYYNGARGSSGAPSSVVGSGVSVSASGGRGGLGYRMNGDLISGLSFTQGSGGTGGAGSTRNGANGTVDGGGAGANGGAGSLNNLNGGNPLVAAAAPGGGGGGYCAAGYKGGGGGGGGYSKVVILKANGPAKGSTVVVTVGAGGAPGTVNTSEEYMGSAGARGQVKISWE